MTGAEGHHDGTALDLVLHTLAGELTPEELTSRLRQWVYLPRRRVYATLPQEFLTPDSLDAVDVAYFTYGLLTDDDYVEIIESAAVRTPPSGPVPSTRERR